LSSEIEQILPQVDLWDSFELVQRHRPIEQPPSTATFIVFTKANRYYVKDGRTGSIIFEEPDYRHAERALQAAIDALPSRGGKVVLSEGTYTISDTIKYTKDNVCIEGMSPGNYWSADYGATVIKLADGVNKNMLASDGVVRKCCSLRNITLDGNKANNTAGHGVDLKQLSDATLERVAIINPAEDGFTVGAGAVAGEQDGLKFLYTSVFYAGNNGYYLNTGSAHFGYGVLAYYCGGTGFYLRDYDTHHFFGVHVESCGEGARLYNFYNSEVHIQAINNLNMGLYVPSVNHSQIYYTGYNNAAGTGTAFGQIEEIAISDSNDCVFVIRATNERTDTPTDRYGLRIDPSGRRNTINLNVKTRNWPIWLRTGAAGDFLDTQLIGYAENLVITGNVLRVDNDADVLPEVDVMLTGYYRFHAWKELNIAPTIGVNDIYGSPETKYPFTGRFLDPKIKIKIGGTFGTGETVTVKIEYIWRHAGSEILEKSYTATGEEWLDNDELYFALWKGNDQLKQIKFYAKTNLASTAVIVNIDLMAMQI